MPGPGPRRRRDRAYPASPSPRDCCRAAWPARPPTILVAALALLALPRNQSFMMRKTDSESPSRDAKGQGDGYVCPPGVRWKRRPSQVLSFIEPSSNVTVVLVGCMHYSPASAQKLTSAIFDIAGSGHLRSVLIEMCPERWGPPRGVNLMNMGMHRRAFLQAQNLGLVAGRFRAHVKKPKISWNPLQLQSEMYLAEKMAHEFEAKLVLGDEKHSETLRRAKADLKETLCKTLNPCRWPSLMKSFSAGVLHLLFSGGFTLRDSFDPMLLLGAPVALLRYLIAAFRHGSAILLLLGVSLLNVVIPEVISGVAEQQVLDQKRPIMYNGLRWLLASGSAVFSFSLLHMLLTVLLEDRNHIIANSIADECGRAQPGEVVIAVLGMAHCSGVRKILLQGHAQRTTNNE